VVRLDGDGRPTGIGNAFDHIGIERALGEEVGAANRLGLCLEHVDEGLADELALGFRIGDAGETTKEQFLGFDVDLLCIASATAEVRLTGAITIPFDDPVNSSPDLLENKPAGESYGGSAEGLAVDSPVIIPLGEEAGLVGKVSEVLGPHSAVVLLLTDEMFQVSAKLENSQEQGILSGQRGATRTMPNLRLRYLSKEADAKPGTKVYSSGAGELFPAGLVLGEVVSLTIGVIDAEVVLKPAVNFDDLVDLFVILPTQAPETEATIPEAAAIPAKPVSAQ
jgi:hypothetical protein